MQVCVLSAVLTKRKVGSWDEIDLVHASHARLIEGTPQQEIPSNNALRNSGKVLEFSNSSLQPSSKLQIADPLLVINVRPFSSTSPDPQVCLLKIFVQLCSITSLQTHHFRCWLTFRSHHYYFIYLIKRHIREQRY